MLESIRLYEIIEHFPDGMFTIDTNLMIQYSNPAFCKLLGYTEEELLGTSITDHLSDLAILDNCMMNVRERGRCDDQETVFKRKDGSPVHISKNVQALYDSEGNIHTILVSIRDMSALLQMNKELMESKFDPLTKLPNRTKLLSELEVLDPPFSIILINIDSFKEVNAFYGHAIADQLLIAFANHLTTYAKDMKEATVYKLPVDEYVILIKSDCSSSEVSKCASDLPVNLNKKIFSVEGQEIQLNVTIGIASSGGKIAGFTDKKEILAHSDMALKLAKKRRKNFLYYDDSFHIKEDYENNLSWIKRLRDAIEEDRVVPFYQPIVDANTLQCIKYEALVRIIEKDGTVIAPIQFLEISKKVKLYPQITMIVLKKVFEKLMDYPEVQCSINLSIEDIIDDSMNAHIINEIKHYPHANRIIFEILESEGIENYETINKFITEVKKYGVKIALDDFGAGYSNFVYITKLDIDYIKIDGSIIRNIHNDSTSQIITNTIIDFASQLKIETIAEFVCDENVYRYLTHLGLSHFQGYYFSEPLPTIPT